MDESLFKERFNILYEESNLTQEEFGNKFKASKSQVFHWRNGSGEPDTSALVNIANACNVSVDWLTGKATVRTQVETTDSLLDEEWPEVTRVLRRAGRKPTDAERRRIARIIKVAFDDDEDE